MALPGAGSTPGGYAVPPDPRLAAFVAAVRDSLSTGAARPERLAAVAVAVAGLAAGGLAVPLEARRLAPEHAYGRNLLYRDPDYGFVVIAMTWPAAAEAPVHDHGTWCGVAVLEGRVRVSEYRRRAPRDCRVEPLGTRDLERGASCLVRPPLEDVHRVWNPFPEPALTLHTYGRDITRCRVFDVAAGTAVECQLDYANTIL